MNIIFRALVGIIGLFALFGALQHWFSFDAVFTERGMQAIGDIGKANLRADVGGLFLGISLFTLYAAVRENRSALIAAGVLLTATLMGRFISIALDGYSAPVIPPIIVEAVVLGILAVTYRAWSKKPEGL